MGKFVVSPMSKIDIRKYANKIRELLGYTIDDYINAPKLFDQLSVLLSESGLKFDYRVVKDGDNQLFENEEAYTDMTSGVIYIRESVMEQACRRSFKRANFTLIHELGHYLLHFIQNNTRLERVDDSTDVKPYCDPEWQADTFASEFLMPFETCAQMSIEDIRKKYHVSRKAAEVRYEKIQREKAYIFYQGV